ncbi:hypothetical protein Hanom_Chr13g01245411 [Helianthus anomalus]
MYIDTTVYEWRNSSRKRHCRNNKKKKKKKQTKKPWFCKVNKKTKNSFTAFTETHLEIVKLFTEITHFFV